MEDLILIAFITIFIILCYFYVSMIITIYEAIDMCEKDGLVDWDEVYRDVKEIK